MFERFTDRSRQVVVLASQEARELGHHHIGVEHIVLGLINEGQSLAGQALDECGARLDEMRAVVGRLVGPPDPGSPMPGHIPFTPRAKKVLEMSHLEALRRYDKHIGTEHLLLSALNEGENVGVHALRECGVEPEVLRQALRARMDDQAARDRSVMDRLTAPGDDAIRTTLRRHTADRQLLRQVLDSLESLHRRLDAMGAPPDPGK
uniref:Clp protease N-terminal domain-containing protein n=1 Tax=Herbidospora sakaeratensis TaxID=564415 RepID=UPI00078588D5|nr:Clp protease N-terminal domain-containing protein [Herbidospora sakaeratensis]